jgi:hypothetical protein
MISALDMAIRHCELTFADDERIRAVRAEWEGEPDQVFFWYLLAGYLRDTYAYEFPVEEARAALRRTDRRGSIDERHRVEVERAVEILRGKGVLRVHVAREEDGITEAASVLAALPARRPVCLFPRLSDSEKLAFVAYDGERVAWKALSFAETPARHTLIGNTSKKLRKVLRKALPFSSSKPRRAPSRAIVPETREKSEPAIVGLATDGMGDCIGLSFFAGRRGGVFERVVLAHLPGGNYHESVADPAFVDVVEEVCRMASATHQPMQVQALICLTPDRLKSSDTTPQILERLRARRFPLDRVVVYVDAELTGFAVHRDGRFGVLSSARLAELTGE